MKKKIKADSVDELFEIVKAIQNGEEPEAYVKRKAEEERAARLAAQKAEEMERAAAKEARRAAREERAAAEKARRTAQEEQREEDAFERELEEETGEDFGDAFITLKGYLTLAGSFIGEKVQALWKKGKKTGAGVKETGRNAGKKLTSRVKSDREHAPRTPKSQTKQEKSIPQEEPISQKEPVPQENPALQKAPLPQKEPGTQKAPLPQKEPGMQKEPVPQEEPGTQKDPAAREESIHNLGKVRLADTEAAETAPTVKTGKTRRRYGAKSVSEEAETVGRRILHSLHMEPSGEKQPGKTQNSSSQNPEEPMDPETLQILDRILDHPAESRTDGTAVPSAETAETSAKTAETSAEPTDTSAEPTDTSAEPTDTSAEAAETSAEAAETSAEAAETSAGTADISAKIADPSAETTDTSVKITDPSAKTTDPSAELTDTSQKQHLPDIRKSLERWKQTLTGSGSSTVRLGGAVILLIVVLVVVVLSLTNHMLTIQKKKKYVTADQGLNLLVENQPEEWCASCELQLKISAKSGTISSVTIGGVSCTLDEDGYVTVTAEEEQLEAVVVTDTEKLTAAIEIPMLDAQAPTLTAEKSGGEIILTAEDARSGVEDIWYAVLDEGDWLQLPVYQKYSEPIAFEEDKTYYFYAADQAGNCSTPVVTSMETAESLSVSAAEISLFPGETEELSAEVNPSGALFTGLSYTSSDTAVATVSTAGVVTAVAAGSAVIQVSADGLEAVSCQVDVVSEQTVTISAIGDCTLGTYAGSVTSTSFDTYYSMYGATWFFENVREILENDDYTFANLEGTLTDETTPLDKTYAFKGDPSYTEILLDGSIEVVTLANNHSSDYGSQSLVDTKENLTGAGIEYCIGDTIAYEEISGVKVAFIGIYELSTGLECESQVRETIAEAQGEGAQLIIVAFHWGTEKETAADETQQSLAHTAIDCGADLVVGHHPHVLQGIEKYNGKYIVYSLGNFCFGGNSNPSDKDTMIFRQTFTITSDGVADDDAIEIIPCTLSSASSYNDYRPTPATGSAADEIMERINEYSSAFGDIVYTASTGV